MNHKDYSGTHGFLRAAVLVVAMAITREGMEIIIFMYGFSTDPVEMLPVLVGGAIGAGIGISLGVLIYYTLINLPDRIAIIVPLLLLALVASGMASQAVVYLMQGGLIESQLPVWDTSGWVAEKIPDTLVSAATSIITGDASSEGSAHEALLEAAARGAGESFTDLPAIVREIVEGLYVEVIEQGVDTGELAVEDVPAAAQRMRVIIDGVLLQVGLCVLKAFFPGLGRRRRLVTQTYDGSASSVSRSGYSSAGSTPRSESCSTTGSSFPVRRSYSW